MEEKIVVIAGAGPAGLTAAYELIRHGYHPIVMEASSEIGGISKTVNYKGNRIDIGGHRFFSRDDRINEWWNQFMPLDADPEKTDRAMLRRPRVSRIYFLRKFFDYPVSLKYQTLAYMGLWRTLKAVFGYMAATMHKRPETSLENFYINRFGKPLYQMFFEDYTEKVWGIHPSKLGADWGSQRVKGLSVTAVLKDMIQKRFTNGPKQVETSLIEEFVYPKHGPGQLWETVASEIQAQGGEINLQHTVTRVHVDPITHKVTAVTVTDADGKKQRIECSHFISTMPIKDLLPAIEGIEVPQDVIDVATNLPYRDFITVGLLVDRMKIRNTTKRPTFKNRVPDTWIYIQERDVKIGRLQVFNNWSPYMVADNENAEWIGLEYFCTEGDALWTMPKDDFIKMAITELEKIDILEPGSVLDAVQIKVKKAYPAYYGSYYQLDKVKTFLDTIPNLWCCGRNGQHRYNNMDHSMLTAMATVQAISANSTDHTPAWSVNTEESYHESK